MKLATPIAIVLGCSAIALAITWVQDPGPQYQIIRLTEGRIARLDQRDGSIAYCSVSTRNADRYIECRS